MAQSQENPVQPRRSPWLRLVPGKVRRAVAAFCAAVLCLCVWQMRPWLPIARAQVQTRAPATSAANDQRHAEAVQALRTAKIANQALELLRTQYVDPDKLHPRVMLEEALQAASHQVPEMLVDAPQIDAQGEPLQLRIRIADSTWTTDVRHLDDPLHLGWVLLQALRFCADHLPDDVDPSSLEFASINGMLSTLDQFSRMLDPGQWRDMQSSTGGQFGGLGIVILAQDGVLTVQSVLSASPAEKTGLLAGDQILQIDGDDTVGMSVDEAVERLRGQVGTTARLQLRRKGWMQPQEVAVVRAVIHLQSVEARVLDNGIGYAKIKSFQRGTADELGEVIDRLLAAGSLNGLVLDLRDNPGGLLDEAIRIGDLFLSQGPVVITVTGGRRQRDERLVSGQGRFQKMPLAVLINGHSASASEVVAGALKYSGRAIVLGEQSFGKASVQVPYEFGGGALKLTVAKYLVPGDVDLMGVGITPDIGVQFISATREQVSLFGGPHYSRAVKKVRTLMAAQPPARPKYNLRILLPDIASASDGSFGPVEVMEREPRQRAAVLLRRGGDVRAAVTLAHAQNDLQDMAHADDVALVAHLKKQGIEWQAAPNPEQAPDLNAPLRLQIADQGGVHVTAGDILRMSVTLTNVGHDPLYRLHVLTRCDDPALDGHEQLVGRLDPGQQRTVHFSVRISLRHGDLQVPLRVVAAQDGQVLVPADETIVTVAGRDQPDFSFRMRVQEGPAGDGILHGQESAKVLIEVRNRGKGVAQNAVITARGMAGSQVHVLEGRARLGVLEPGAQTQASLAIEIRKAAGMTGLADLPAQLEVTLTDEALGVQRAELVTLPQSAAPLSQLPVAQQKELLLQRDRLASQWADAPEIIVQNLGDNGLEPLTGTCHLELQVLARFDGLAPSRRFVTISVAGVKQAYEDGRDKAEVGLRAPLRLDSGLSTVTIQAQAGPSRLAERQLLVHCRRDGAAHIP